MKIESYLALKGYHDTISSYLDCLDDALEDQFSNASVLMVIPDHDLVRRIPGLDTSSHQHQQIRFEQKFHDSKT